MFVESRLRRRQRVVAVGRHRNLPPEHAEQDADASRIIHAIENGEVPGERSRCHPDRSTHPQLLAELQNSLRVGRGDQRFNDPVRHRMGLIALHHQACHAKGAIDAAPLMARQIKRDEQIAGEERGFDRTQLARVPDGFVAPRQESAKTLILELDLRAPLAKRSSPLRFRKRQTPASRPRAAAK